MLTFHLHWADGRDVVAVIELDQSVGPFELPSIDAESRSARIVVPLALTFGTETDFLRFLETKTRDAQGGEVRFAATAAGMQNLQGLFPKGGTKIDMPLSSDEQPQHQTNG